ncbi:MAG TPA: leucine--tRNA ligase [Candidatus Latescibacteria bacterium]|nr:leucine--tRNA ligase [Candidatus Latescibacterota bacterium]
MKRGYDFEHIESKWQRIWAETDLYKTREKPSKKYYMLEMFAYTSGDIHMGHFRNYAIGDVVARYKMMQGYDLLHPFGWDAFGLPAEEAAIKHGIDPEKWTLDNINVSRATLKRMGISYDWDREVITCLPDYYKWTQWIFLRLFNRGLAYQDIALVNWCPRCKTVLANEQVEQGSCWRCHSEVGKRELKQWFFRITAYAERLLNDLDKLNGWPENVKIMQRNWIGKSAGTEIVFSVEGTGERLPVFTTRPDTVYGVTFMAIAPEDPLARKLVAGSKYEKEVCQYIEEAMLRSEIDRTSAVSEKTGVFTGRYAVNPLSGDRVGLWVADYVVASYGTGIVMGVPAHDQRDFEFARRYGIPIKVVINPPGEDLNPNEMEEAYVDPGIMINSQAFNDLPSEEGARRITDYVAEKGIGGPRVNYKLRDWLVSRQRYWGAPIPIIHCETCGPVPEPNLPVLLPGNQIDFIPKGRSPLADVKEFMETECPRCGRKAERDPDTMDTFVCSSWYHLRYTDPHNDKEPFSKEAVARWLPIDKYIGGVEHACMHLLYFRFITKVLYDEGLLPYDEPTHNLFNHGMVLDKNGEVMSKSKGNVVSPLNLMKENGADVSRVAMFFAAPSEREILWNEEGIRGARRFLNRIYNLTKKIENKTEKRIAEQLCSTPPVDIDTGRDKTKEAIAEQPDPSRLDGNELQLYRKLNRTIKKVTEDIEKLEFNTAIAAQMEFLNELELLTPSDAKSYSFYLTRLAQLLAPFAPHLAEEFWQRLGYEGSIFKSSWPTYDPGALEEEEITMVVQINGKVRAKLRVSADIGEEEARRLALEAENVKRHLAGKHPRRVIVVPGKLVSIVV